MKEALDHPKWRHVMIVEMWALEHNGTWDLVPLPPGQRVIGCHWVYGIKVGQMVKLIVLNLDWW